MIDRIDPVAKRAQQAQTAAAYQMEFLGNGPAATGGATGWSMTPGLFFRCIRCDFFMASDPAVTDTCLCGDLHKDASAGRFGSNQGDAAIEVYRGRLIGPGRRPVHADEVRADHRFRARAGLAVLYLFLGLAMFALGPFIGTQRVPTETFSVALLGWGIGLIAVPLLDYRNARRLVLAAVGLVGLFLLVATVVSGGLRSPFGY